MQVKLLQDKGMERWLQPGADKLYGFTHVFLLLHLDKQSVLAGPFFFFLKLLIFIACSHIHHLILA